MVAGARGIHGCNRRHTLSPVLPPVNAVSAESVGAQLLDLADILEVVRDPCPLPSDADG
jgi:hypothetical protein